MDILVSMLRWGAIIGGVAFLCGFVGPVLVNPDANQGPLLGIFITGPGGFVLGLVFGLVKAVVTGQGGRQSF